VGNSWVTFDRIEVPVESQKYLSLLTPIHPKIKRPLDYMTYKVGFRHKVLKNTFS